MTVELALMHEVVRPLIAASLGPFHVEHPAVRLGGRLDEVTRLR